MSIHRFRLPTDVKPGDVVEIIMTGGGELQNQEKIRLYATLVRYTAREEVTSQTELRYE